MTLASDLIVRFSIAPLSVGYHNQGSPKDQQPMGGILGREKWWMRSKVTRGSSSYAELSPDDHTK